MTDDASPENLRKFLESDDLAMRRMGLSMAKGSEVPEELLGLVAGLYMWDDDKGVRGAAKSVFNKYAPDELKYILKETWKTSIRTLKRESTVDYYVRGLFNCFKGTLLDTVDVWRPPLEGGDVGCMASARILEEFGEAGVGPLIKALGSKKYYVWSCAAEALGRIGGARAVDALVKDFQEGSRQTVSGVLTIKLLKSVLVERGLPVSGTKKALIQRVADFKVNADRGIEPLIKAINDKDSNVRLAAVTALGELGDTSGIDSLAKAIDDKDSKVRVAVAKALEKLGKGEAAKATKLLSKQLGDKSKGVRRIAVKALGMIGREAVNPLIKALDDKDVRKDAVKSLGSIGDARAVAPLNRIFEEDETLDVREAVRKALKSLGHERTELGDEDEASAENLRKFLESDDPAMRRMGLSMVKGSGVPEEMLGLVAGLYMWDDDKVVRAAAKSTFTKHAPDELKDILKGTWNTSYRKIKTRESLYPKVKKLVERCKDTPLDTVDMWKPALVRTSGYSYTPSVSIVPIMVRFGAEAVEPLIKALEDRDVDQSAADALWKIGKPAVEPLIGVLVGFSTVSVDDRRVRGHATKSLGKIGDERAVEPLITVLEAELYEKLGHHNANYEAVVALGNIGDMRAVKPLTKILGESYSWVNPNFSHTVAEALDMLGWEPDTDELRVSYTLATWNWHECVKLGELVVAPMIRGLQENHDWSEPYARVLGKIGNTRAVEPLIEALKDRPEDGTYWQTRAAVASALGMFKDVRAVEPLIETFVDALKQLIQKGWRKAWGGDVVRSTAWALGNTGDTRAITPLFNGLSDTLNVEQWGEDTEEYMVAECIQSIVDALAEFKDKDAIEQLINLLCKALGNTEHIDILKVAIRTLGKIGKPAVEALINVLENEPDNNTRDIVIGVLGTIGDIRAVECLVKALEDNDENVRHNALMALSSRNCVSFLVNGTGSIQNDIVEMLVKILVIDSTNYMTSFMAVRLLGEIGDTRAIEPLKKALDNTRTHQVAKEALKKLGHDVE